MKPDGLFERLTKEIGCKRIVVDSISLFQYYYASAEEQRKVIYSLRNTLRKYSLTSLLLKEVTSGEEEDVSFINYLADGVITLDLQPHYQNYRKRTLEITKMRGSKIQEGEHLYRISDKGIHLIPALSMVEDEVVTAPDDVVPTGIGKIDQVIGGGVHHGSVYTIDTNSKSNYRYLITSMKAHRLQAGEKILLFLSSLTTLEELEMNFRKFGMNLAEYAKNGQIRFIEHYRRAVPEAYKDAVINVANLNNEEYKNKLHDEVFRKMEKEVSLGEHWSVYYDLNTIASQRGNEFVKLYFGVEVAKLSSLGVSTLVLTNYKELGEETSGFVERSSNGVIRTWVDGNYQFLQVTKTPKGQISEPFLVEKIEEKPFMRLV